jgi:hypothetical protein
MSRHVKAMTNRAGSFIEAFDKITNIKITLRFLRSLDCTPLQRGATKNRSPRWCHSPQNRRSQDG